MTSISLSPLLDNVELCDMLQTNIYKFQVTIVVFVRPDNEESLTINEQIDSNALHVRKCA